MGVRHVRLRLRVGRAPDLLLRQGRRLEARPAGPAQQALRPDPDRIHRHFPAPRRQGTRGIPRRNAVGSARARRARISTTGQAGSSAARPPFRTASGPMSRRPSRSPSRPTGERPRTRSITRRSPPLSPRRAGEKAPALVLSHGGPTSSASSTLSLGVQYWTSRGIGVLDVNYRGSTGYGRAYRLKLERQWGVVDVADCVHGAEIPGRKPERRPRPPDDRGRQRRRLHDALRPDARRARRSSPRARATMA